MVAIVVMSLFMQSFHLPLMVSPCELQARFKYCLFQEAPPLEEKFWCLCYRTKYIWYYINIYLYIVLSKSFEGKKNVLATDMPTTVYDSEFCTYNRCVLSDLVAGTLFLGDTDRLHLPELFGQVMFLWLCSEKQKCGLD